MSPEAPPPTVVELLWQGDLRFAGHAGSVQLTLDAKARAGPSPVQALVFGLAGCMATDVVDILTKGRYAVDRLQLRLVAQRRAEEPRRLTHVDLHFEIEGDVPADRVERAIELSRERYCTVWHSLRPDIEFRSSFSLSGGPTVASSPRPGRSRSRRPGPRPGRMGRDWHPHESRRSA